jgi:hypothetical protein
MTSLAQTARKNLLLRGLIAAVVVIPAFATVIAFRHLVPKELPRLISETHAVRRELARAERINLRTGVTCEEGILPHAGKQLCAIAIFPVTFHHVFGAVPMVLGIANQLNIADLGHSTVLNL